MEARDNGGSRFKRITWTTIMDKCLVDLMRKQAQVGGMIGQTFSRAAWHDMLNQFNEEMKLQYDMQNLKNHFKILRRQYHRVRALCDRAGFSWDPIKKCVVASDDSYWNELLVSDQDAAKLRNMPLPHQESLHAIFSSLLNSCQHSGFSQLQRGYDCDVNAIKENGEAASMVDPKSFFDTQAISVNPVDTPDTSHTEDTTRGKDDVAVSDKTGKRSLSKAFSKADVNRGRRHRIGNAVAAIKSFADAYGRKAAVKEKLMSEKVESLDKCMSVLGAMEGLDRELHLKAISAFRDDYNRLAFLRMSTDLRLDWLKLVCGENTQKL